MRQNEPSSLSLNEIKTGTFPTKSEEGRLTFQKVFKKKAGSETRNRGCEGRGTSKHDVIGGEGGTKLDGTGVEGSLEPQEPGRWENRQDLLGHDRSSVTTSTLDGRNKWINGG